MVNENNGVLILSTGAGCYEELKEGAICINPYDIRQTAESIDAALLMDETAKKELITEARAAVARNDLNRWVSDQLQDLEIVMQERQQLTGKNQEEARLGMN